MCHRPQGCGEESFRLKRAFSQGLIYSSIVATGHWWARSSLPAAGRTARPTAVAKRRRRRQEEGSCGGARKAGRISAHGLLCVQVTELISQRGTEQASVCLGCPSSVGWVHRTPDLLEVSTLGQVVATYLGVWEGHVPVTLNVELTG